MSRTAVILGATGLVGRECVTLLARSPAFARITALTRRPDVESPSNPVVQHVVVDFDRLEQSPDAFTASHVFCALGTTIRRAGSRARLRQVDLEYPLRAAELALAAGARHFLLVSSVGASERARGFYLRVKGELERRLVGLGYRSLTIARPSLLLGQRAEFRFGEQLAQQFSWAFPPNYRAVDASDVARALVGAAMEDRPGVRVIENVEIRRASDSGSPRVERVVGASGGIT